MYKDDNKDTFDFPELLHPKLLNPSPMSCNPEPPKSISSELTKSRTLRAIAPRPTTSVLHTVIDVETREEARKRKKSERQTSQYAVRNVVNRLARDRQAEDAGSPLRVLDMDEHFEKETNDHAIWPQLIN